MIRSIFYFALVVSICLQSAIADIAKISVLVQNDETGMPVKGVNLVASFGMDNGWSAWKGGAEPNVEYIVTDKFGRGSAIGRTNTGHAGCHVQFPPPDGYYLPFCGGGYEFKNKNLLGVWQPDDLVVTIRLQRVERPVPLFVKDVNGRGAELFSKGDGRLLFDFVKGDWLPPVGSGEVADAEFIRLPRENLGEGVNFIGVKSPSYRDSMDVVFLGKGNGIVEMPVRQEDMLRVRTAPEGGYTSLYRCWSGIDGSLRSMGNYDRNRCFCFRIRTRMDGDGNVTEAYYGKIYGDIRFRCSMDPSFVPVASVSMRYYLNPVSLDRNLEWNMHNLCPKPDMKYGPEPLP